MKKRTHVSLRGLFFPFPVWAWVGDLEVTPSGTGSYFLWDVLILDHFLYSGAMCGQKSNLGLPDVTFEPFSSPPDFFFL